MGLLTRLDIFSQPFQFKFEGKAVGKKTIIGSFVSVVVIALLVAYLIVLLIMWFSGHMKPIITVQQNSVTSQSFTVKETPIILNFITAGQDIELEQYFAYEGSYFSGSKTANSEDIDLTPIMCSQQSNIDSDNSHTIDSSSLCLDVKTASDTDLNLKIDDAGNRSYFEFYQLQCRSSGSVTCASDITSLMSEQFFYIDAYLVYYEFDVNNEVLSQKLEKIVISGDYSHVGVYRCYASVSLLRQDRGWLWNVYTDQYFISGYRIAYESVDRDFFINKVGGSSSDDLYFNVFHFEIVLKEIEYFVQYAKLTTVLAQFSAMVSTFMLLGIIAQVNSDAQIYQEMGDVSLQEYYKITAETVIDFEVAQFKKMKEQNAKKGQGKELSDAQLATLALQKRKRELSTLYRVHWPQQLEGKNNKVSNKIQSETSSSNSEIDKIHKLVLERAILNMNVSYLFRELYQMKTAIQLLMSPEQYAASFYCGREIPEFYAENENRNHLETQDYIHEDVAQRQKFLKKFLDKDYKSSNQFVDQNIINSMLNSAKRGEFTKSIFGNKRLSQIQTLKESEIMTKSSQRKKDDEKQNLNEVQEIQNSEEHKDEKSNQQNKQDHPLKEQEININSEDIESNKK